MMVMVMMLVMVVMVMVLVIVMTLVMTGTIWRKMGRESLNHCTEPVLLLSASSNDKKMDSLTSPKIITVIFRSASIS